MKKSCSQQLLHFHPVQRKINTTNYTLITKLGFSKPKYENNIHQNNKNHILNFVQPQNFLPLLLAILVVLVIPFSP